MSTWVSWTDDGVAIYCDRPECMVPDPRNPQGGGRFWWCQEVSGERLQPSDLQRAIDQHENTH